MKDTFYRVAGKACSGPARCTRMWWRSG